MSEDPIGFTGTEFNLYRYVGSAPLLRTDPSGNIWVQIIIGGLAYFFWTNEEPGKDDGGKQTTESGKIYQEEMRKNDIKKQVNPVEPFPDPTEKRMKKYNASCPNYLT